MLLYFEKPEESLGKPASVHWSPCIPHLQETGAHSCYQGQEISRMEMSQLSPSLPPPIPGGQTSTICLIHKTTFCTENQ